MTRTFLSNAVLLTQLSALLMGFAFRAAGDAPATAFEILMFLDVPGDGYDNGDPKAFLYMVADGEPFPQDVPPSHEAGGLIDPANPDDPAVSWPNGYSNLALYLENDTGAFEHWQVHYMREVNADTWQVRVYLQPGETRVLGWKLEFETTFLGSSLGLFISGPAELPAEDQVSLQPMNFPDAPGAYHSDILPAIANTDTPDPNNPTNGQVFTYTITLGPRYHSADYQDARWLIDVDEFLQFVQLFEGYTYEVDDTGDNDGYRPFAGPGMPTIPEGKRHTGDYQGDPGTIDVDEFLRLVKLFEGPYYRLNPDEPTVEDPDGFIPSATQP